MIALLRPVAAEPFVLRFHVPYLALCTLIVAIVLLAGREVGWRTGAALVVLYVVYLAVNLANIWG